MCTINQFINQTTIYLYVKTCRLKTTFPDTFYIYRHFKHTAVLNANSLTTTIFSHTQ